MWLEIPLQPLVVNLRRVYLRLVVNHTVTEIS